MIEAVFHTRILFLAWGAASAFTLQIRAGCLWRLFCSSTLRRSSTRQRYFFHSAFSDEIVLFSRIINIVVVDGDPQPPMQCDHIAGRVLLFILLCEQNEIMLDHFIEINMDA